MCALKAKSMCILVFLILSLNQVNYVCGEDFESFLLVAAGSDIIQVGMDNDGYDYRQLNLTGYSSIRAVDFDYQDRMVYFTDASRDTVSRCFLDGTVTQVIVSEVLYAPTGLALDVVNRKVYWSDGIDEIVRANLDGSGREVIHIGQGHTERIEAIVIDSSDSLMYWGALDFGIIWRSNLNGSNRHILANQHHAEALVLDKPDAKLYWFDRWTRNIEVYNLTTGTRHTLLKLPGTYCYGIAIVGDYIFWTDFFQKKLGRADKITGANQMLVGYELPAYLTDIHFYGG